MSVSQMNLVWQKCVPGDSTRGEAEGKWCSFLNTQIDNIMRIYGVYIIWFLHTEQIVHAIYVGEGNIGERIQAHRKDERITAYHDPFFTFASVATKEYGQKIERYLWEHLDVLIGNEPQEKQKIQVNLPPWVYRYYARQP